MHDQGNGDRCMANKRKEADIDKAVAHLESNAEPTKQIVSVKAGEETGELCSALDDESWTSLEAEVSR